MNYIRNTLAPENKESGYDGIIKDINDPDTDMPTIMFDSQKNLGKAIWQPCKINNQDCLNFTLILRRILKE